MNDKIVLRISTVCYRPRHVVATSLRLRPPPRCPTIRGTGDRQDIEGWSGFVTPKVSVAPFSRSVKRPIVRYISQRFPRSGPATPAGTGPAPTQRTDPVSHLVILRVSGVDTYTPVSGSRGAEKARPSLLSSPAVSLRPSLLPFVCCRVPPRDERQVQ